MEVYIIANIRNNRNTIKGYRLLDIDGTCAVKDVKKEQLVYVIKHRGFKIENAKLSNGKIMGTMYPLDSLANLICNEDMTQVSYTSNGNNRFLLLKTLNNKCGIVASIDGIVKRVENKELAQYIKCNSLINAIITTNGVEIKCKKEEINTEIPKLAFASNYVSKKNTSNYISDEEARDKNVVWSTKRFIEYMEQRGYEYRLRHSLGGKILSKNEIDDKSDSYGYVLSGVDYRCKIIHLPNTIHTIERIYDITYKEPDKYNNINIDTLIIPESVKNWNNFLRCDLELADAHYSIHNNYNKFRLANIDFLWFQHDSSVKESKSRKLDAVRYLRINCNYNVPYITNNGNIQIENVFHYCTLIKMPDIEFRQPINIVDSFRYCTFACNIIELKGIKRIRNAFDNIVAIGKDNRLIIKMHSDNVSLNKCFSKPAEEDIKIVIQAIDMAEAVLLEEMEYCFTDLDVIGSIDMTNCIQLAKLNNCFCNAPSITELKLPSSLKSIGMYCFLNSDKIKYVKYPDGIKSFGFSSFHTNTQIIYPNTIGDILTKEMCNYDANYTVNIPDCIRHIGEHALLNSCMIHMHNTGNLETIGRGAFSGCTIKEIDYNEMPKVTTIEDSTFSDCKYLKTVILSNSIKKIGDSAFSECSRLEKVLIGESVETIGKDVFKQCNTKLDGVVIVYTIEGCKAHKKLRNQKNVTCVTFSSYEEALSKFNNKKLTPQQQNKFRLISSANPEYDELKQPMFIEHSLDIMKICELRKQKTSPYEGIINESSFNFSGVQLDSCDRGKELSRYIDEQIKESKFSYDGKYTRQFAGYVELLTTISKGNNHFITEDNIEDTLVNAMINPKSSEFDRYSPILYIDNHCQILRVCCTRFKMLASGRCWVIMIVINKTIVWSTLASHELVETIIENKVSIFGENFYASKQSEINPRLLEFISVGDKFSNYPINTNSTSSHMINGMNLPKSDFYTEIWKLILLEDLFWLGVSNIEKLNGKRYDSEKDILEAAMYSLTLKKIIIVSIKASRMEVDESVFANTMRLQYINSARIKDMFSIKEFDEKSKKYKILSRINDNFNNSILNTLKEILGGHRDDIEQLKLEENAYDFESDMHKEGLVQLLGQSLKGNYDENKLSEYQINALLNMGLCKETNLKFSDLFEIGVTPSMRPIAGSNKMLIEIPFIDVHGAKRKNVNYYYTIKSLSDSSDSKGIYVSYFSLRELLAYANGLCRQLEGIEEHKIDNKPVNTDDFMFLLTCTDCCKNGDYTKLYVAIQRQTLECFILADDDDISYHKLFRFKNFFDADNFLFEYEIPDIGVDRKKILEYLSITFHNAKINTISCREDDFVSLHMVRMNIMKGLPNGSKLQSIHYDIFKKLSKQPNI